MLKLAMIFVLLVSNFVPAGEKVTMTTFRDDGVYIYVTETDYRGEEVNSYSYMMSYEEWNNR